MHADETDARMAMDEGCIETVTLKSWLKLEKTTAVPSLIDGCSRAGAWLGCIKVNRAFGWKRAFGCNCRFELTWYDLAWKMVRGGLEGASATIWPSECYSLPSRVT